MARLNDLFPRPGIVFVNDGAGRRVGIVLDHMIYATNHVTLVVHVCATAHLPIVFLLGGLAKASWA